MRGILTSTIIERNNQYLTEWRTVKKYICHKTEVYIDSFSSQSMTTHILLFWLSSLVIYGFLFVDAVVVVVVSVDPYAIGFYSFRYFSAYRYKHDGVPFYTAHKLTEMDVIHVHFLIISRVGLGSQKYN